MNEIVSRDTLAALRHNYVGGEFLATSSLFENRNPVDGSLVSMVAEADQALVDRAVACARHALNGEWAAYGVKARVNILRRIADRIDQRFDEFVDAEIADTGKPLVEARVRDIPRGAANFRAFADLIAVAGDESFKSETADGRGALNYVERKPLGVIAIISPWNLPLLLLTWKVAPALACGNVVIAKPSEETPSTATLLAEVMHEVGVPPGVFNLLHGFGPNSTGEYLTRHPGVDGITFTGESSTGSAIMKAAAHGVRPVSFELGGKERCNSPSPMPISRKL
jgi:aminomuconate-semialdehyde/2-hydroxymuconate-6-semialdehyde dehydrogenase